MGEHIAEKSNKYPFPTPLFFLVLFIVFFVPIFC